MLIRFFKSNRLWKLIKFVDKTEKVPCIYEDIDLYDELNLYMVLCSDVAGVVNSRCPLRIARTVRGGNHRRVVYTVCKN